jgi:hypothetical protein
LDSITPSRITEEEVSSQEDSIPNIVILISSSFFPRINEIYRDIVVDLR